MSRSWCFTYNNPVISAEDMLTKLQEWVCTYAIVGIEIAPTSSTLHLQGYVYWKCAKQFTAIIKKFPGIHWEIAKGTAAQNREYCKKDGDSVEFGECPRQGARNDLGNIKDMVKKGRAVAEILEDIEHPNSINFMNRYMAVNEMKRNWKPLVEWYWGPTGSGKTRKAHEVLGDNLWMSGAGLKWWQGYDAHENVLIDDFRENWCELSTLLRILDRYAFTVETKGGSRQLLAKYIIITAPRPPKEYYRYSGEDIGQLLRRIDRIVEFPETEVARTEVAGNNLPPLTEQ